MTVLLINALYAAETLAAFHRGRVAQTLGVPQGYHQERIRRLEDDIEHIRRELNSVGGSVENQARAIHSRDMRTAQEIVTTHLPMEWRADTRAPEVMGKMAQAIADAMQTARGATNWPRIGAADRGSPPARLPIGSSPWVTAIQCSAALATTP